MAAGLEAGRRQAAAATAGGALALSAIVAALVYGTMASPRANSPRRGSTSRIACDRYYARYELDGRSLTLLVSFRLRTQGRGPLPARVFVVGHRRASPATGPNAAVWPPSALGKAVTAAGYFHGADPGAGHPVDLTGRWQRINARLPAAYRGEFETVTLYVLAADGRLLLRRSFRIRD